MCMNSLRRVSLGLIARNPNTPSANPNQVGISAVGCWLPVPKKLTKPSTIRSTANKRVTFAIQDLSSNAHHLDSLDELPHHPMHNSDQTAPAFTAGCAPTRLWQKHALGRR